MIDTCWAISSTSRVISIFIDVVIFVDVLNCRPQWYNMQQYSKASLQAELNLTLERRNLTIFSGWKKGVCILYAIIDRRTIISLTKSITWKCGCSKVQITGPGRRKEQLSCSKLKLQFLTDSEAECSCTQSQLLGWLRIKRRRVYALSTKFTFYW